MKLERPSVPAGTIKRGKVITCRALTQTVKADSGEEYILVFGNDQTDGSMSDSGTLEFKASRLGTCMRFKKDEAK